MALLATNPAIPDRDPTRLAQNLLARMLPRRMEAERRSLWENVSAHFHVDKTALPTIPQAFRPSDAFKLAGMGAENLADTRPVLESREALNELLISGIYGKYNQASHAWEKVYFPVARPSPNPAQELTFTALDVSGLENAMLHVPLNARLIAERVKGLTNSKKEILLVPQQNSLGEVTVTLPRGVLRLVYSIEIPLSPTPLEDPDAQAYEKFATKFEKVHGHDLRVPLGQLPYDILMHVRSRSFQALSPKRKLIEIEGLVRSLGWYDTDNGAVNQAKRDKAPEEQFVLSEQRLKDLRHQKNVPAMVGKRFAGVCADFALITCTLLREAGFLAGIMRGLQLTGKTAAMKNAHATAFVAWPDEKGDVRLVSLDGTPSNSDNPLAPQPNMALLEQEQEAEKNITHNVELAEETIRELLQAAKADDVATISHLQNGKLERALNIILRYEVKQPQLKTIEHLLNVYWYNGIARLDRIKEQAALKNALKDALEQTQTSPALPMSSVSAGTDLLESVRTFVLRMQRVHSTKDVFARLNQVTKLSADHLSDVEHRALMAVIAYLQAQKMKE